MQRSPHWEDERYLFEKLKRTNIFRYWKRTQFDCQTGKCAYCGKPIQYRWAETDHIKPLYYWGDSEPSNMVLCHHNCNKNKSTSINYHRPEWIRTNRYDTSVSAKYHELKADLLREKQREQSDYPVRNNSTAPKGKLKLTINRSDIIGVCMLTLLLLVLFFIAPYFSNRRNSSDTTSNIESTPSTSSKLSMDDKNKQFAQSILASYASFYNNYVAKYPTAWSLPRDEFNCMSWPQNSGCTLSLYAGATVPDGYTYSVNTLEAGVIFEQNETIPHALKTNAALYKRARCEDNGTVIGGSEDANAAVVIELSDGTYYCVQN